jgi:outer membrane receptor protein involved in Fe transport
VLSRSFGDSANLRLRYEKIVGQLNFNTFAASPSLDTGIISAGNAELEPEESQDFEVQFEKRFWGEGSAIVTLVHTKIDNALDYIPVGDFDALGNAGPATKSMLVLDLAVPFDRFGWSGATFRPRVMYLDSEITDPFTGQSRQMSSRKGFTGSFGFTWELPNIQSVFGVDGYLGYNNYAYRVSEERKDREVPGALSVWWDKTFRDDYTLHVEVHNLTQQRRERYRDLYADGRVSGVIMAHELRETAQEPHLILKLRKRF